MPRTETMVRDFWPCIEYIEDPTAVCDRTCPMFTDRPPLFHSASRNESYAGVRESAGACSDTGDPPRPFLWPAIPVNAIRRALIVPDESRVTIAIDGVGTSVPLQPESGGSLTISGGGCDFASASCPMQLHHFDLELPHFTIGSHSGDDVGVRIQAKSEGLSAMYRAPDHTYPDEWSYTGMPIPFEVGGLVDGETAEVSYAWGAGTRDVLPDDLDVNLRRGPERKFLDLAGTATTSALIGDGPRAVTVSLDLEYYFYAGSPVAAGHFVEPPGVATAMLLDATSSWDELGGTIRTYDWLAVNADGEQALLGYGPRMLVPKAVLQSLQKRGYKQICVRVIDSDTHSAESCFGFQDIGKWPPGSPPVDCVETSMSSAMVSAYRELLEASQRLPGIRNTRNVTYLIPTNQAIQRLDPSVVKKLRNDAAFRNRFLDRHTWKGVLPWEKIAPDKVPPVDVDRPCPEGMTHVVGATAPGATAP